MGLRRLKKRMDFLLRQDDFERSMEEIFALSPKSVINVLFSFFFNSEERTKWRSIQAMGKIVATLATSDMEYTRIIMRRLIWNLNDESGGIGWGSPEAMGEIMANHNGLADEFHKMLISYIMPEGNFIEHELLQRGVLWGIGRLAHEKPALIEPSADLLVPYMKSTDPYIRGFAAWVAGCFIHDTLVPFLTKLKKDPSELTIYRNDSLLEITVGELVTIRKRKAA